MNAAEYRTAIAAGVLSACMAVHAQPAAPQAPAPLAAPSQQPLLSRPATGVAPNVILTIDDSWSMRATYLPESAVARIGAFAVPVPSRPGGVYVSNGALRFHPSDLQANEPLVAGTPGSNNWRQAFLRSPDTNPLYYNPEVRYLPWVKADGSRYPQASFTRAAIDPAQPTLGTLDLSLTSDRLEGPWCYGPVSGNSDTGGLCTGERQAFDAGLFYRLQRSPGGQFLDPQAAANYVEYSVSTGSSFRRHPGRTDCAGLTCTQAEERLNFATWFAYHRSRMLAAKAGIGEALQQAPAAMRMGWGRLSKQPGPVDGLQLGILQEGVRDYDATRRTQAMAWLYDLQPVGGTPLREAVQEVTSYFRGTQPGSAWTDAPGTSAPHASAKTCRRAYHVLVTDGAWSSSGEGTANPLRLSGVTLQPVGNSDGQAGPRIQGRNGREFKYLAAAPFQDSRTNMLADYAMEAWKNDLQPSLANEVPPTADNPAFWQHLTHFTVGFGVGGHLDRERDWAGLRAGTTGWAPVGSLTDSAKIDDLWHAAVNSRGEYFGVSSPAQLASALAQSLTAVTSRELMEAGVATASATLEADNRKYVPSYRTGTWSGDVEAFRLDERGQGGARAWSARQRMPAWQQRNIVTWDAGTSPPGRALFRWDDLSQGTRSRLPGGAALVDYLRGDRAREQPAGAWRKRDHLLGDFVNSTPVLAAAEHDPLNHALPVIGASYADYVKTGKRARAGVLWVGGNAGMLHGFMDRRDGSVADGREVFAYVPHAVLDKLPALAAPEYGQPSRPHQFFVDGPLRAADVHVPRPGSDVPSWRNYLFGSTGAGARAVFGLDITDPQALGPSTVRWEHSAAEFPELGHVLFPIASGQLPGGRWVAVFGNGWGGKSEQAVLFVVDVATGRVWELSAGVAGGNGLGGVVIVRSPNGEIDRIYAGDLKGQLWRFDPDAKAASGFRVGLAGRPLFQAAAGQAILQAPAVFPADDGGHVVVFGTGRLVTAADADDATVQSVYGVRDTASGPPRALTTHDLEPRQLSTLPGPDGAQEFLTLAGNALEAGSPGWRIDLSFNGWTGLRVIYPVQPATDRYALLSAVLPASAQPSCENAAGRGINLLLPVLTGLPPAQPIFDTNGDGRISASDALAVGYTGNADGADSILRGATVAAPQGVPGATGCLQVSIQNTGGQMGACIPQGSQPTVTPVIVDRVWRRILNPPIR